MEVLKSNVAKASKSKAKGGEMKRARSAREFDDLDLINGHLSHARFERHEYQELRGYDSSTIPEEFKLKNWYRPSGDTEDYTYSAFKYVAKVQPLKAGGYELLCREMSPKFLPQLRKSNPTGKRDIKTAGLSERDIASSRRRAVQKVRLLVKSMGCDRLLTLTVRETTDFLTREQLYLMWKRFVEMCKKNGFDIGEYVVVPEKHKKGNYHLHAVISGYVKVNYIRAFWLRVCRNQGKAGGNIDVSYKPNLSALKRAQGCAKYVTKYISKSFSDDQFNKKRYSCSRHKLPESQKYILRSNTLMGSVVEIAEFLGLNVGNSIQKNSIMGQAYFFARSKINELLGQSECTGFWLSYTDELAAPVPF